MQLKVQEGGVRVCLAKIMIKRGKERERKNETGKGGEVLTKCKQLQRALSAKDLHKCKWQAAIRKWAKRLRFVQRLFRTLSLPVLLNGKGKGKTVLWGSRSGGRRL